MDHRFRSEDAVVPGAGFPQQYGGNRPAASMAQETSKAHFNKAKMPFAKLKCSKNEPFLMSKRENMIKIYLKYFEYKVLPRLRNNGSQ